MSWLSSFSRRPVARIQRAIANQNLVCAPSELVGAWVGGLPLGIGRNQAEVNYAHELITCLTRKQREELRDIGFDAMRGAVRAGYLCEARVPFHYRLRSFPVAQVTLEPNPRRAAERRADAISELERVGFRLTPQQVALKSDSPAELSKVLTPQTLSNSPTPGYSLFAAANLLFTAANTSWTHYFFAPGLGEAVAPLGTILSPAYYELDTVIDALDRSCRDLGLRGTGEEKRSPEELRTLTGLAVEKVFTDDDMTLFEEVLTLPLVREALHFIDFFHQRWAAYVRAARYFVNPFTAIEADPQGPLSSSVKAVRPPPGHNLLHEFLLSRTEDERFRAAPAQVVVSGGSGTEYEECVSHFTDGYGTLFPMIHCSMTGRGLWCVGPDPAETLDGQDASVA